MMEQKTKFIIIGLIGILVISLFMSLKIYRDKQTIAAERDTLRKENILLVRKSEEHAQDNQRLKERVEVLNRELDRVSKEKVELQKKMTLLTEERNQLIDKLKGRAVTPTEERRELTQEDTYWAQVLKAKTNLEIQVENMRKELEATKIKNEQFQREKSTLELEVSNLARERNDLVRQIDYNQKMVDSLSAQLVNEKNDKMRIQESLRSIRRENALLINRLKNLSAYKANLETKIQGLQEDKDVLQRRFVEMETLLGGNLERISHLKDELDALRRGEELKPQAEKKSVELPPIVVRPPREERGGTEVQLLAGKILVVNEENRFVIIDSGEDSGIKVGQTFQVYRQDKPIADIEVVQTRKEIAACDIKREIAPIKIGDEFK